MVQIVAGTARYLYLQLTDATGALVTSGTIRALITLANPGVGNDGYYWDEVDQAWESSAPAFANWLAATHINNGLWRLPLPAAASTGLASGAIITCVLQDSDGSDSSAPLDVQITGSFAWATAAALDTVDNFLDTEVAAILAAVDTEVAAIAASLAATGPQVSHTMKVRNGTLEGDPGVTGIAVDLLSSAGEFRGRAITDANGNAVFAHAAAGSYRWRVNSPANGWTATVTEAAFTLSNGGSTVIAGTSTAAPAPGAGKVNISFAIAHGTARQGVEVKVRQKGGWAPISGTPDTSSSVAAQTATTNGSGVCTIAVLSGVPFFVLCDELEETGRKEYVATSSTNFAVLQKAWRP